MATTAIENLIINSIHGAFIKYPEGDGGPNLDYEWITPDQSAHIAKAILLDLAANGSRHVGFVPIAVIADASRSKEKAARRRLLNSNLIIVDQAASNAGLDLRRYAMNPMPAKPRIIIAQVEGSGTAPTLTALTRSVAAQG
jgi:hypothetical protein